MNAFGDDYVSFTAMDLSLSPNGKYLLVSTGMIDIATNIIFIFLRFFSSLWSFSSQYLHRLFYIINNFSFSAQMCLNML